MGKKHWDNSKLVPVFDAKLGRMVLTLYPSIRTAQSEVYAQFCRLPIHSFTDEELEMARRFDVEKALEDAISARKAAGLPIETNSK